VAALGLLQSAAAQSKTKEYTTDLSGHRVADAVFTSNGPGQRTQLSQSINGRLVPLQETESKVLSQGPNGRVTETVTRYYGATGQLASTERTVAEEKKGAAGQSSIKATIYRSDVQGRMVESERRDIETSTQGNITVANVTVDRPDLSGSFETAEKRKVTTVTDGNLTHETEALALKTPGGQFTERARVVRETETSDGTVKENVSNFELNYAGRMEMMRQQISTTQKASDGSAVTELAVYAIATDGVTRDEQGGGQKLKEQQIIVKKPQADGTVVETTSVRRPTLADSKHLGAPVTISETVCSGKCDTSAQK